jgi:asparagine synthase (glutamine-hydrolysing)
MCGLTGLALGAGREAPGRAWGERGLAERLEQMARTIAHRGPDDDGFALRDGVGLGFRRLSIIDVAGGHQPLFNETGDIGLVGNGEVYNFRELRAGLVERGHAFRTGSDMETLLHLYEERGADFVRDLVGMFAFAIADWRELGRPKVLLGRDPIGVKPLYWGLVGGTLVWGSEAKAVLASGLFERRLRRAALLDVLVAGYVGGDDAAWSGLQRLAPGTTLSWQGGDARVTRYFDLPTDGLREPASRDEILGWLDRVVQEELVADVPLGAFLSGGIDSTAVVTAMAAARPEPVVACSVGFRDKAFDELERARATARRIGAVHHTEVLEPDPTLAAEVLPWHFDEPLADPSTVPTYLVSKVAREHVTVALSGDGGDETFAGYRRYVFDVLENRVRRRLGPTRHLLAAVGRGYPKLDWAPRFLRAKSVLLNLGADPARAYWNSQTQLARAHALELLDPDVVRELGAYDPFDLFHEHYRRPAVDCPLYRAQYADFKGFLPDQILTKTDRASMATSLEVRVPLLDHRFVSRFVNLPADEKVRHGRGKHALREALRGRLPDDVLDGPKKGFDTPLASWLRGPLSGALEDALASLPATWFRRDVLQRHLAEHRSGFRNHAHLLWTLFVLEHWRRRHAVEEELAA